MSIVKVQGYLDCFSSSNSQNGIVHQPLNFFGILKTKNSLSLGFIPESNMESYHIAGDYLGIG